MKELTMDDATKVNSVILSYIQIINKKFGKFIRIKAPITGKHFQNCVDFFDLAHENNIPIHSLMSASLAYFPKWWCNKIFKRDYPSITILVSEKARSRGLKDIPKEADGVDKIVDFYLHQLNGMSPTASLELIDNGFLEGMDYNMKEKIILELKRRMTV